MMFWVKYALCFAGLCVGMAIFIPALFWLADGVMRFLEAHPL